MRLHQYLESTSQRVLDRMHKSVTEQNYRAAEITRSMGIGGCSIAYGANRGVTREALKSSVDFIMKYNLYDQIQHTPMPLQMRPVLRRHRNGAPSRAPGFL